MIYEINSMEKLALDVFITKHKALMRNSGTLALLFSRSSGIGVFVIAKIRDADGNEVKMDITDYTSW